MIEKHVQAKVYGKESSFSLKFYTEGDIPWVKRVFSNWMSLRDSLKEYNDRSPNIPEAISETMYCILTGVGRFTSSKKQKLEDSSFDAFDMSKEEAIQIKAGQIEKDLSTFGPKTRWDKLVFVDFFNDGNMDGTVDIYEIPTESLNKVIVCQDGNVTFEERKASGKRPHLSLKESLIYPNSIEPIYKKMKLW